jgi:hypothetical protein
MRFGAWPAGLPRYEALLHARSSYDPAHDFRMKARRIPPQKRFGALDSLVAVARAREPLNRERLTLLGESPREELPSAAVQELDGPLAVTVA